MPGHTPSLALDLGTHLGWAHRAPDGRVQSGTVHFIERPTDIEGARFLAFHNWLAAATESRHVQRVFFERVQFSQQGHAAEVWFGWLTCARLVCLKRRIPLRGYHTSTLKLTASGHGKAGKERMVAAARSLFPDQAIQDDNQADALCCLYVGELDAAGRLRADISAKASKTRASKPRKPGAKQQALF